MTRTWAMTMTMTVYDYMAMSMTDYDYGYANANDYDYTLLFSKRFSPGSLVIPSPLKPTFDLI